MFELVLNKSRTCVYDIDLYGEDGVTGVTLDTGDKVRLILYRRPASTPAINLLSGDSATVNGSSISITSTVPTPAGTVPRVRINLGQADLATIIGGAPLKAEIIVTDANGTPTNALMGPIHGIAYTISTSSAVP